MHKNYDLILKGGRVIDPATGLDGIHDLAVTAGRIVAIEANLPPSHATEVIDVRQKLVIPGMIDPHAHVFRYITGVLGMDANWVGVQSGVTTLVEQGGVSAATLPGFVEYVVKAKANRVHAFLAPYAAGGVGGFSYPDQFTPGTIDVEATLKAFETSPQVAKGMKFWAEQASLLKFGDASIRKVRTIVDQAKVPMYVHMGELWRLPAEVHAQFPSERVLETVLPFMRAGDIFAHAYTDRLGGFFNADGSVRSLVRQAIASGIHIDLGYGAATNFKLVRQGLEQDFLPQTLGADIHAYNTAIKDPHIDTGGRGRFNGHPGVAAGMNLLMAFGVPLERVIPMATSNPARIFLREQDGVGTLKIGAVADITVLDDLRGRWRLTDTSDDQVLTERLLHPSFCLKDGLYHVADSALLSLPEEV
ncbi:amidohydrolase family protein [Pseudomonas sp. GD03860]|uniref:amidohydrolase family protein n=1 Tax=Pseudomonas TaxID=286 RepID=UPI0023645D8B|nr:MULTISPECIES: amidohydrolase family protein [Pseudomonas]MDD2058418.1 amidohydrolase family protein [Pseudomonas putida]MDH0640230.1 amidohydrolase family protein [Pseudomonas sp. GD03860]